MENQGIEPLPEGLNNLNLADAPNVEPQPPPVVQVPAVTYRLPNYQFTLQRLVHVTHADKLIQILLEGLKGKKKEKWPRGHEKLIFHQEWNLDMPFTDAIKETNFLWFSPVPTNRDAIPKKQVNEYYVDCLELDSRYGNVKFEVDWQSLLDMYCKLTNNAEIGLFKLHGLSHGTWNKFSMQYSYRERTMPLLLCPVDIGEELGLLQIVNHLQVNMRNLLSFTAGNLANFYYNNVEVALYMEDDWRLRIEDPFIIASVDHTRQCIPNGLYLESCNQNPTPGLTSLFALLNPWLGLRRNNNNNAAAANINQEVANDESDEDEDSD